MISAVSLEPVASRTGRSLDYHHAAVQPTLLPDAAASAPTTPQSRNDLLRREPGAQAGDPTGPARKDSSSMFAAAVIAGALAPRPQTVDELMRRIGTSPIPEESEARLKDLLA